MNEPENEARLAEELAHFLDRAAREEPVDAELFARDHPELSAEVEALAEIDRAITAGGKAEGEKTTSAPAAALPERLSGHRIIGEIGSGGMGRVLLAEDEALGRKVAIKTLHPKYSGNDALRTRFMREARAMARLAHPNVARIYSLGPAAEEPHFVMEYVEGTPLTGAARASSYSQKAELMRKVALAAAFLHEQGFLHRDLKPGNVLVGADLEPKLLDFGLALDTESGGERLSATGVVVGTVDYFSPEQARGENTPDPRSDVFALGAVLYETLTGVRPFEGDTTAALLDRIRKQDPVLPRRIAPEIPQDLQNVCLKALEKDPAQRYESARAMADDLRRFLAGEPVLAAPGAYSRLISAQVEEHLREIDGWRREQIISEAEYEGLRGRYGKLADREDAWILEARRLTLPQVTLYLGAWLLAAATALIAIFHYPHLKGAAAVVAAVAATAPAAWLGLRNWDRGRFRVAIAFLFASCLLLPVTLVIALGEAGIPAGFTQGRKELELFAKFNWTKETTNAQLWWCLLLSAPAYLWLRRYTRSSLFSLPLATAAAVFSVTSLLRLGMLEWLDKDPGRTYLTLIPWAAGFLAVGLVLERLRQAGDSRYFYPFAVVFTYAALSGVAAFHEPYANWLRSVAPWTRGQVEYLFILNAGVYLLLDLGCSRLGWPQIRTVGKWFRFVIAGHVLTSLWLLGLSASDRWRQAPADTGARLEARLLECFLPVFACAFVFGSIPKQMKNFFVSGLVFVAIGVVRLQQDLFEGAAAWPLVLLVCGLGLMLAAANYAPLRMALGRGIRVLRPGSAGR